MSGAHSPVFKNTLEKMHNASRFMRHRAQLELIAREPTRYPQVQEPYKSMLYDNRKSAYFRNERNKQIDIENTALMGRLARIKSMRRSTSFWRQERPRSLNETVRGKEVKFIDEENSRLLSRILCQKPSMANSKLKQFENEHVRLSSSISKVEKYRLPGIDARDYQPNSSWNMKSPEGKSREAEQTLLLGNPELC